MSIKQVIVMRKDLNMRKGKIAAQAAHASMAAILNSAWVERDGDYQRYEIEDKVGSPLQQWLDGAFTKICVYVENEQQLIDIYEAGKKQCKYVSLITDNGTTEFNGVPTKTCVAIGPDTSEVIDKITGHLKLY